ncbi:MAG: UDP-2,3-diacylglucosamine hydrolase [Candidatus Thiodiazotropha sp. (ex Epidulcina cf. delphinae)]|nr:UDP-2,3-diacylglucosamine hydrolase [Candidatus Thiodiazotropha sp. (ex Epidulcina cf. delphinae)]
MRSIVTKQASSRVMSLILLLPGFAAVAGDQQADLLVYRVEEAGSEPYLSRILVTPGFLRMDQDNENGGFILYDREAQIIYSVDPDERSILVIEPERGQRRLPEEMKLSIEKLSDIDAPAVSGSKPEHWRMTVNGTTCQQTVVAPGLMPQGVAAYRDYLDLLAYQHVTSLAAIPAEYRDGCDDAIHVFAPSALLEKGLPLRTWDANGNQQTLIDFSADRAVSSDRFKLPADYRQVPMSSTPTE